MSKIDWRRAQHPGRQRVSVADESEHLERDRAARWLEKQPARKWPTAQEIAAKRTNNGGWKRAVLAEWGVPWPPPKGWRQALLNRDAAFFKRLRTRDARNMVNANHSRAL